MPEPRSRTSDIPDFDTYPAPAPAPDAPTAPESAAVPERELPEWGEPRLNQTAARVGRAAGQTVIAARGAAEQLRGAKERVVTMQGRAREGAAHAAQALRQEAGAKVGQLRYAAEAKLEGARAAVAGRIEDLRGRAAEAGDRARQRAMRVAHEEPVKVILAAGIAAFAAGVALRLWRSSHD